MPGDEFAAVIVEPIQGEGGYVVPEDDFLPRLRELCDRHGILLIADEVQSGAGRTGKMWAIQHWDVEPDILLTAKGIASGHADRRDDRQGRRDELGPGRPRLDVRRQPGRAGRAHGDGPAARGRPHRQRPDPRPRDHGRPGAAPRPVPGDRPRRPRQGPDDRHPVRLRRDRRGRPDAGASTAACSSSRRATTASGCRRRSSCRRPRPRPPCGCSSTASPTSRRNRGADVREVAQSAAQGLSVPGVESAG